MSSGKEEVRVVLDTVVFVKAVMGIKPGDIAYSTMVRACHKMIVSWKILEQYMKTIREKYGYRGEIIFHRIGELTEMGKIRRADRKLGEGVVVKVTIPDKDLHIAEAAVALRCKYIVSEDNRHFLSKKDDFHQKHSIEILSPGEYVTHFSNVS